MNGVRWSSWAMALLVGLYGGEASAERAVIAVASNFAPTLEAWASDFRAKTGDDLVLVPGSTGKLYAQLREGAPFDVFMAADRETPRKLFEEKLGGTPFSYAIGTLVLWSKREGYVDDAGQVLWQGSFRHLAFANPELAPYGRAARQFLTHANLWVSLSSRFVLAENVAQAHQFIDTENAELGFVALSQVIDPARPKRGSYWVVPEGSYDPLIQDAQLLTAGSTNAVARRFVALLRSEQGCTFLRRHGYRCPRQVR